VSINHDQIDRDGDVYEEEDKEEEREAFNLSFLFIYLSLKFIPLD
jgi:hypothetical protein